MANERVELTIALNDQISDTLHRVGSQFESLSRRVKETGEQGGTHFRRVGDEINNIHRGLGNVNIGLGSMGTLMKSMLLEFNKQLGGAMSQMRGFEGAIGSVLASASQMAMTLGSSVGGIAGGLGLVAGTAVVAAGAIYAIGRAMTNSYQDTKNLRLELGEKNEAAINHARRVGEVLGMAPGKTDEILKQMTGLIRDSVRGTSSDLALLLNNLGSTGRDLADHMRVYMLQGHTMMEGHDEFYREVAKGSEEFQRRVAAAINQPYWYVHQKAEATRNTPRGYAPSAEDQAKLDEYRGRVQRASNAVKFAIQDQISTGWDQLLIKALPYLEKALDLMNQFLHSAAWEELKSAIGDTIKKDLADIKKVYDIFLPVYNFFKKYWGSVPEPGYFPGGEGPPKKEDLDKKKWWFQRQSGEGGMPAPTLIGMSGAGSSDIMGGEPIVLRDISSEGKESNVYLRDIRDIMAWMRDQQGGGTGGGGTGPGGAKVWNASLGSSGAPGMGAAPGTGGTGTGPSTFPPGTGPGGTPGAGFPPGGPGPGESGQRGLPQGLFGDPNKPAGSVPDPNKPGGVSESARPGSVEEGLYPRPGGGVADPSKPFPWRGGGGGGTLTAGPRGLVDKDQLQDYLTQQIAGSPLGGLKSADAERYGIKTGSPQEWAALMTKLAGAESSYKTGTVGDVGQFGGHGSRGLFQLSPQDAITYGLQNTPFTHAQLADPAFNARMAIAIMDKRVRIGGIGGQEGAAKYWAHGTTIKPIAQSDVRPMPRQVDRPDGQQPSAVSAGNVIEGPYSGSRRFPIGEQTREQLEYASAMTGLTAHVFSGTAQAGTPGARSGRHAAGSPYGAGDLYLTDAEGKHVGVDDPRLQRFMLESIQAGAHGVGAGHGYMEGRDYPEGSIHIGGGGGKPAYWGAGERSAGAPDWLKRAFEEGRGTQISRADQRTVIARAREKQQQVATSRAGGSDEFSDDSARAQRKQQEASAEQNRSKMDAAIGAQNSKQKLGQARVQIDIGEGRQEKSAPNDEGLIPTNINLPPQMSTADSGRRNASIGQQSTNQSIDE